MVILKHGKVILFSCDACGCTWSANRNEVGSENDAKASVDSSLHIRFYMKCPDCGNECMEERARALWDENDLTKA